MLEVWPWCFLGSGKGTEAVGTCCLVLLSSHPVLLTAESPVPVVYVTPWQFSPWMFSTPSPTHFRANRLLQRGPRSVGFPVIHRPSFSGLKCTWVIYFERFRWLLRYTLPSLLQPFLRLGHHFLLGSWGHEKEKTPSAQRCSCFWASFLRIGHCRPLECSCPYSRSSGL